MATSHRLARPVIFGAADGMMSILGVVFYAAGHHALVFPVAVAGGLSAAVSMAGGEWLSESSQGPAAAVAMGVATLTGSVLPAVPYAVLTGPAAPAVSVLVCVAVAAGVARLRVGRRHRYLETFAVLAGVLALAVACTLAFPGGTG